MECRLLQLLLLLYVVKGNSDCGSGFLGIHVSHNGEKINLCEVITNTAIPGICSQYPKCGVGASCKADKDMCTCDEPGFNVGPKGTPFENMCTAGGANDCKIQDSSSSKCLMPLFIRCEDESSLICKCEIKHMLSYRWRWTNYYFSKLKCEWETEYIIRKQLYLSSVRTFWITGRTTDQNNKSCIDEWTPEYTCGCKKGDISCEYVVGAKCSGKPDPSCYVPPGIHCNEMGMCDCDRSKNLIWVHNVKKCVVTPGGSCSSTEDCVVGTECTDGKCSACPGTAGVDLWSGKCKPNIMDLCQNDMDRCPEGTECKRSDNNDDGYGYVSRCRCSGENVKFDPKLKICALGLGEYCEATDDTALRNCKTGTVCIDYECVCNKSMGLVEDIVKTQVKNYIGNYEYKTSKDCFVMENNKCKLRSFKCKQYNTTTKLECLKSKVTDGQYSYICTVRKTRKKPQGFDDDGQGHNIGSFAVVVGFGLAIGTIF